MGKDQGPSPAHFSKNSTVLELSERPGELLERGSSPAIFTKYGMVLNWKSKEILLNLKSLSTLELWQVEKEEVYKESEIIKGFMGQLQWLEFCNSMYSTFNVFMNIQNE